MKKTAAALLFLTLTVPTFAAPKKSEGRFARVIRIVKRLLPATQDCTEAPCIQPSIPKP